MIDPRISRREATAGALAALLGGSAFAQARVIAAKFRLENGRVIIDAHLNGQGPYPFVVDTGAVISGVKDAIAKTLGLKYVRDLRLGQPPRMFPMYSVDDFALGGAVRQANVALFGLEGDRLGGDGLLASGMVVALDSELDFDAREWRIHPGGRASWDGYTRLESEIDSRVAGSPHMFIQASYNGQPLKLLVDTGAPRPLSLDHAAARRLGLDALRWAPIRSSGIHGVDSHNSRLVRGGSLTVGPHSFETGVIAIRGPKAPASIKHDGLIGLPIIQRMNLAIQAKPGAVWIKPSGLPFKPYRYGGSGVWLDASPGGAKVAEVAPGSPAALAGLRAGDRIVGEPDFGGLIRKLGADFGATVEVSIDRGGKAQPVSFILADYL